MKHLKLYEEYSINEGRTRRTILKIFSSILTTIGNIKSLLKGEKLTPYRVGNKLSNIFDFLLMAKSNAEYYEGNILDEYEKIHGRSILDDIDYIKDRIDIELDATDKPLKRAKLLKLKDHIDELYHALDDFKYIDKDR